MKLITSSIVFTYLKKTFKWYHKIFFKLLITSLLSGHKLNRQRGGNSDIFQYLHDVAMSLLANVPQLRDSQEDQCMTFL